MSETRQELTEYQRAAAVARFVEVGDVSLVSMGAELLVPKARALGADEARLAFDKKTSFEFDEETRSLTVNVKLIFNVKGAFHQKAHGKEKRSDTTEEDLLRVACAFRLQYAFNVKGGPPADERDSFFAAFANVNGMFNAWPYVRELVHSTVARMGLPPMILPVYRVASETPRKVEAPPKAKAVAGK